MVLPQNKKRSSKLLNVCICTCTSTSSALKKAKDITNSTPRMFEEEERILKADGRARGTEIGNKIYEKWFTTAKKHAKLTLEGGGVQMLDTTRKLSLFLCEWMISSRTWVKTMSIRKENSYAIQKRFFFNEDETEIPNLVDFN